MFSDLVDIIDHKKDYCKLRFTCKCDYLNLDNNHDHATSDVNNETGNPNADNQQNKGKRSCNILPKQMGRYVYTFRCVEFWKYLHWFIFVYGNQRKYFKRQCNAENVCYNRI